MPTRTQLAAAAAAALTTFTALTLSLPRANAADHSGTIYAYGTPALNGPGGTFIVTGAIGDYGTSTKVDPDGQIDPQGPYNELVLQHGTITTDGQPLSAKIQSGSARAKIDPVSCSLHGSVSANEPIVSGSGQYAGAGGNIDVTFTFAELGARTASGACDPNAEPIDAFATIAGSGNLDLP